MCEARPRADQWLIMAPVAARAPLQQRGRPSNHDPRTTTHDPRQFGSRTDDKARGGDLDLYIETEGLPADTLRQANSLAHTRAFLRNRSSS